MSPGRRVRWSEAFRLIPTRHPPVQLFERIGDPSEWEALADIESLTNPRIRDELGDIRIVPFAERASGPGASFVMAPFVHRRPSRFSDGSHGVYYCARSITTAVYESAFHVGRFYRATREPALEAQLRVLCGTIDTQLQDLRKGAGRWARELDPDDWGAGQALGARLRLAGSNGVVYPSVRDPGGTCAGVFRPRAVGLPAPRGAVAVHWNGERVDRWFDYLEGAWREL